MSRGQRRNLERDLRKERLKLDALVAATQLNGADFPIDRAQRKLLDACNSDVLAQHPEPFPHIWSSFRGFLETEPGQLVSLLKLAPERDHAFHFSDFFAFLSENDVTDAMFARLEEMPEGVVFHYSPLGDPHDTSVEDPDGARFAFCGASLIRRGGRLHWMALGGPICDLDAVTAERREQLLARVDEIRAANPHSTQQVLDDIIFKPTAVPVPGTDDVWQTIVMGVFNLTDRKHEIRLVGKEWSVSLAVFSDEFEQKFAEAYGQDAQATRLVDKAMLEISKSRTMFELAESAFALPAYFAAKVELSVIDTVDTKLKTTSGPDRSRALHAPADARLLTRSIVRIGAIGGPSKEVAYTPPRFQVETDGFYRRISSDGMGRDKDGLPLQGRTWVKAHVRWKNLPPRSGVVRIKTPLALAMAKAERQAELEGGEVRLRM